MCTPEVALVQQACAAVQAGKVEEYMAVVSDDLKFNVLGGLVPADKCSGNTKAAFMECGAAQEKVMQVTSFVPHSWTGRGCHVAFVVDWEFVYLGDGPNNGKTCHLKAVVHKIVKEGKICEKYHIPDQRQVCAITGAEYNEEKLCPGLAIVKAALGGMALGKPEEYFNRVAPAFDFDVLGDFVEGKGIGSTKEEFMKCAQAQGKAFETVRFVPHSYCGYGEHVTFCCEWEIKLNTPKQDVLTLSAVVYKMAKDDHIHKKYHCLCQYHAKNIGMLLAQN